MDNSVELKKGRKNRDKKRALVAYSFIAPNFIGFAVFTLVPIVCAFALGFLKWDGNNPIQFVGLENFKELGGEIITIGSDAHKPEDIAYRFEDAYEIVKAAGFKAIASFRNKTPKFIDIK